MAGEEMNELYEFIRIIMYLVLAVFLIQLGITVRCGRWSIFAIAGQFVLRGMLLFFQVVNPDTYREVNNYFSTPFLVVVLTVVIIDMLHYRKL